MGGTCIRNEYVEIRPLRHKYPASEKEPCLVFRYFTPGAGITALGHGWLME